MSSLVHGKVNRNMKIPAESKARTQNKAEIIDPIDFSFRELMALEGLLILQYESNRNIHFSS